MTPSEDDWVGEPPEGRHRREQARPDFWQGRWQASAAMAVLGVLALITLLVILLLG